MSDNTRQWNPLGENAVVGTLLVTGTIIPPQAGSVVTDPATIAGDGITPLGVIGAGAQTGQLQTNANGVKVKTRTGTLGFAEVLSYSGDPNGVITADKGSVVLDIASAKLWRNTTGAMVWTEIGGAAGGAALGIFGDGSDGNVVIAAPTTLARDMYYNNLTVNVGVVLKSGNFRIFVRGLLTLNGDIDDSGNIGGDGPIQFGIPGAQLIGSLPANAKGGAGGRNGNGNPGIASSASPRGVGAGGNGGAGAGNPGGLSPAVVTGPAAQGDMRHVESAVNGVWPFAPGNTIGTGSGGGGGGSDNASGWGGAGGGSGGYLVACFNHWVGAGALISRGGNGGSASGQINNMGGGGGGGGGFIVAVTSDATIPTTHVEGGNPGDHSGVAGVDGVAGTAGYVVNLSGT